MSHSKRLKNNILNNWYLGYDEQADEVEYSEVPNENNGGMRARALYDYQAGKLV